MPNAIDNAAARLLDLAASITSAGATITAASDYPTEAAQPFPFAIAFLGGGRFRGGNAAQHLNFPVLTVEFHFNRANLKQAYQQINAVAVEFPRRLSGDPTLDGTVTTIVFGAEGEIEYTVQPFEYGQIKSQMLAFTVPVKLMQAPQVTA